MKYSTDYDVALKVLGASGRLPCIITQLEQGTVIDCNHLNLNRYIISNL